MIKKSCLTYGVLVLGGFSVATTSADVYFFDDFEAQPLTNPNPPGTPLSPPPIGIEYRYAATTQVEAVNIVEAPLPVIGTKSLEAIRDATRQAHVIGISNTGALVDGKVIEVKWHHYLKVDEGQNPFNAPMQVSAGYTQGGVGNLFFVAINDKVINGVTKAVYQYSDAFLGAIRTDIPASVNGWDALRIVMTLDEFDPTFMTGKYDMYVSQNGGPEIQLANQADLFYAEIGVGTGSSDTISSALFRIQKGPNPARSYFDNITIRDFAATPTPVAWNVDSSGDWSLGSNWSPTSAPNGTNAIATFGSIITAPRTVTLDGPQTVGTANFDNLNRYTIAGTNTLSFDAGSPAGINVTLGSHVISAPVVLLSDLTITSSASSGVALTGNLTATGRIVSKAGSGTAQFENVRATALNVNAGTASISVKPSANSASGTSKVSALTIAPGATLDVGNNSLIIDYSGPIGTLLTETRQNLQSGRLKSGVSTLATRLGYGDNAVLGRSSFAGQSVDSDSVLVKFTYAGDSDLDGDVDIVDLGNLASAWQTTGVWTNGDFDYSNTVDVSDLGLLATNWQAGVGSPLGPSLAEALAGLGLVSVPEPAWMGVMGMSVGAIVSRRRREKSSSRSR